MKAFIITGLACKSSLYKEVKEKFTKCFDNVEVLETLGTSWWNACNRVYTELVNCKEDFITIGHCYGGMISLFCNARFRKLEHWKGIVTCNTFYDLTRFTLQDMAAANEGLETYPLLEQLKYEIYKNKEQEQIAISRKVNIEKFLKYVDLPVLVLGSDKDGYFKEEMFKDMFYKLGSCCGSIYSVIEGSRHMGIIVNTDKYLGMIKMWKELEYGC